MSLTTRFNRLLICLTILFFSLHAAAQNKVELTDARQDASGQACDRITDAWPKEVLFGTIINKQGEVYFTMTGGPWFDQLFTGERDGIAVDIVTKDQYACDQPGLSSQNLPKGTFLRPVYLADLKKNVIERNSHSIYIRVGQLPAHLIKKVTELEGNLVILKNGQIGDYKSFTDIDRSLWETLPMGLYTDTLISTRRLLETQQLVRELCDKKVQCTIPFTKGSAFIAPAALKRMRDSLPAEGYYVRKIYLDVYNSIEGNDDFNSKLATQRSEAVWAAVEKSVKVPDQTYTISYPNVEAFYKDIERTPFASWSLLSDSALDARLTNPVLTRKLEPVLKNHRKAIVTFYLDKKDRIDLITGDTLSARFRQAIMQKNIFKASLLQEEVIGRVADNRLPADYMDSLEVPQEALFSPLLADKETYKYLYNLTHEYEALNNFEALQQIDSASSRIRYNVCALTFYLWRNDTAFIKGDVFLKKIQSLYRLGVDSPLVARMLVNYHIINNEHSMQRADYKAKDRSVAYIADNYAVRKLTDEDMLALAKYLCYYMHRDKAITLVQDRVKRNNVQEDLLFYYLNMQLFRSYQNYTTEHSAEIKKAIQMNKARFCKFFNSINNGGASFQLLDNASMKALYCEECK